MMSTLLFHVSYILLDDPDFQPFRELLTLPVRTHIRRLLTSAILYSSLVWLCIHIPSMVIVRVFPSVTPFHVRFSDPTEMPADLLLFHFWYVIWMMFGFVMSCDDMP